MSIAFLTVRNTMESGLCDGPVCNMLSEPVLIDVQLHSVCQATVRSDDGQNRVLLRPFA